MGIKNQKTLFISASAIIGTTIAGVLALNFTVDKISKIHQPSVAMAPPPKAPKAQGVDDAMMLEPPGKKRKRPVREVEPQIRPFNANDPRMPPPPPQGAARRLRNGQQPPVDIQRTQPAPEKRNPAMPSYPPMYPPQQPYLSPEEQMRMQDEMDRQQDYYPGGPPPYYPPPQDYYDEGYYPNYDGDYYGPEGKNEEPEPAKGKDLAGPDDFPDLYAEPDRKMIDEYLNEFYED